MNNESNATYAVGILATGKAPDGSTRVKHNVTLVDAPPGDPRNAEELAKSRWIADINLLDIMGWWDILDAEAVELGCPSIEGIVKYNIQIIKRLPSGYDPDGLLYLSK